MKDNNNICKALGLKYIPEFSQICAPVLRPDIISYFSYSKIYPDGSRIYLSNKPEWFIRYHTEFYDKGISHKLSSKFSKRVYCRADFIDQEIFRIGREYFQLPDPIFILNQLEDAQEVFALGHGSATNVEGLSLQHYELIQNFIFYFREKSKKLIRLVQPDREILPLAGRSLENAFLTTSDILFTQISTHLREETEDYFFKGNGSNQFLTKKRN